MAEKPGDTPRFVPLEAIDSVLGALIEDEEVVQRAALAALILNGRNGIDFNPDYLHFTIKNSAETVRRLQLSLAYLEAVADLTRVPEGLQ